MSPSYPGTESREPSKELILIVVLFCNCIPIYIRVQVLIVSSEPVGACHTNSSLVCVESWGCFSEMNNSSFRLDPVSKVKLELGMERGMGLLTLTSR